MNPELKNALNRDISLMLSEQGLEYMSAEVIQNLKAAAENMAIKLLKSAESYKDPDKEFSKSDIELAIRLENEKQRESQRANIEVIQEISSEINEKSMVLKESHGVRIPKENVGNCNYKLENPNKKIKIEAVNNFENLGNCFTLFMPPKNYKPNNTGGFVIKNPQTIRDIPMKFTLRPKFNLKQDISILKKN